MFFCPSLCQLRHVLPLLGFIQTLLLTSFFHQGLSFMVVGLQHIIRFPREISSPCSFGQYSSNQYIRHRNSNHERMSKPHGIHLDHNFKVRWIVDFWNTRRNINIEKINNKSYVGPCMWGFIWGAVSLPCMVQGLAISPILDFQIVFPYIIQEPNLFLFQVYLCLLKTCKVTSSPHHHTLNGNRKWSSHVNISVFF